MKDVAKDPNRKARSALLTNEQYSEKGFTPLISPLPRTESWAQEPNCKRGPPSPQTAPFTKIEGCGLIFKLQQECGRFGS